MITLTETAVKELKKIMSESSDETSDKLLRISVVGGGCSGLEYKMGFIEESDYSINKDSMYTQDDIGIVVDKKSELFIDGTSIDWFEDLMKKGFVFNNPKSTGSCGCGESFSV